MVLWEVEGEGVGKGDRKEGMSFYILYGCLFLFWVLREGFLVVWSINKYLGGVMFYRY